MGGTNDFSTSGGPPQAQFALTYRHFLLEVQSAAGKGGTTVPVVLACGPMCAACPLCHYVRSIAEEGPHWSFADLRLQLYPAEMGCAGHPSAFGHQQAASSLIPVVAAAVGWTVPASKQAREGIPQYAVQMLAVLAAAVVVIGLVVCTWWLHTSQSKSSEPAE